jgi:putative transcriptional regulator
MIGLFFDVTLSGKNTLNKERQKEMNDIENIIKIKSNDLKPAKGRILLSEPLMGDYYFGRSAVLLAEHNDEGSFGIILNKPVSARFNDVFSDFPPLDINVFMGGPVDHNHIFYIHTLGDEIADSVEISDGLYWGGDLESIKEMALLKKLNDQNIRFFIGYSGWGARQLESELKRNSWVITSATKEMLFRTKPTELWDKLMRKMGGKYKYWTKFPVDPSVN